MYGTDDAVTEYVNVNVQVGSFISLNRRSEQSRRLKYLLFLGEGLTLSDPQDGYKCPRLQHSLLLEMA